MFKNLKKYFQMKKGVGGISGNVVELGILVVTLAVVATLLANLQANQTANSTAYNATQKGLDSVKTFADQVPTLALVIIFGIILFYLGRYLFLGGNRGM